MNESFFISDLHLNHRKLVEPNAITGERYRPFETIEEMNETIINNINSVVTDKDKLYILGDVVFQKASSEHLLARIKGNKRLVLGNHDEMGQNSYYLKYFHEITVWKHFDHLGFVCSHIPMHPSQFRGEAILNLHGHVHKDSLNDLRYMNVCVEKTGYAPVHLDTIIDTVAHLRHAKEWAKGLDV